MKPVRAGLIVALLSIGASLEAATVTDCHDLQAALDASFPGEAVTLVEGLACSGSFDLPSHPILLQGAGGGATLDGATLEGQGRILSGEDVGATTIRNLTFRNGLAPFADGGAIHITGNSPVILEDNRFFNNEATFAGGAIYVVHSAAGPVFTVLPAGSEGVVVRNNVFGGVGDGNIGDDGGALYVLSDSTVELHGNQFRDNRAFSRGGAASVFGCEGVALHGNTFTANRILPLTPSFTTLRGGALYVAPACDPLPQSPAYLLTQTANVFASNVIEAGEDNAYGGGQAVQGFRTVSTGDRYVRNSITGSGGGTGRGAGLSVEGFGAKAPVFVGRNLVAAGNTFGEGGAGGGLYLGAAAGGALTLVNATVVVNAAAVGGAIAGGPADSLTLHNSIVIFNIPSPEIAGFATRDIRFTDACVSAAPLPGEGNICAVPALANPPDDVHQAWPSVTIDAGSDALVPRDLMTDLDGEMRRSGLGVDMGADEWHPAVCDAVTVDRWLLRRKPRHFATITLSSPVDPWGQPVTLTVTGVLQDEPLSTPRPSDNLAPDAMAGGQPHQVQLRRESSRTGDGRVYFVAFEATYSRGTCTGERLIGVPLVRRKLLDSGPPYYDSFAP